MARFRSLTTSCRSLAFSEIKDKGSPPPLSAPARAEVDARNAEGVSREQFLQFRRLLEIGGIAQLQPVHALDAGGQLQLLC